MFDLYIECLEIDCEFVWMFISLGFEVICFGLVWFDVEFFFKKCECCDIMFLLLLLNIVVYVMEWCRNFKLYWNGVWERYEWYVIIEDEYEI